MLSKRPTLAAARRSSNAPAVKEPRDLERYGAILISGGPAEWTFQRGSRKIAVRPLVRFATGSFSEAREAAVAGVGVVRLPGFYLAAELRSGQLLQLLPAWTPPAVVIAAVYPSRVHLAAKTRLFLEMLTQHIENHPLRTA